MKKRFLSPLLALVPLMFLGACVLAKPISEANPYERIPVIDGYHEGERIWFLHTDVSNKEMAEKMTTMVNYKVHYSEKLGMLDHDKAGHLYVFTNGVDHKGKKPWSGGPFFAQIDVFDSIPGDPDYTPIRHPHLVTWNEGATPRILKSVAEIEAAEAKGEVTIAKPEGVLVNVPIVKWPGGNSRLEVLDFRS